MIFFTERVMSIAGSFCCCWGRSLMPTACEVLASDRLPIPPKGRWFAVGWVAVRGGLLCSPDSFVQFACFAVSLASGGDVVGALLSAGGGAWRHHGGTLSTAWGAGGGI